MRLSGDDERRSAGEWLAQIWREHRWAARRLSKHPAFTSVVILTLGLAIGGNAAIYSVVSSVLLKPLPYPDPDALVRVFAQHPRFVDMPLPPADFHPLREQTEAFSGIAAFYREGHEFRGSAGPENLEGLFVTAGYFELLGARAALGRTFTEEDERPGGADRVILSDRIWRTRLGADPAIIRHTVNLSRRPFEVIGVIAPGLEHVGGRQRSLPHGETVDFWIPLTLNPANLPRSARLLDTVGRLARARQSSRQTRSSIAWQDFRSSGGQTRTLAGVSTPCLWSMRSSAPRGRCSSRFSGQLAASCSSPAATSPA